MPRKKRDPNPNTEAMLARFAKCSAWIWERHDQNKTGLKALDKAFEEHIVPAIQQLKTKLEKEHPSIKIVSETSVAKENDLFIPDGWVKSVHLYMVHESNPDEKIEVGRFDFAKRPAGFGENPALKFRPMGRAIYGEEIKTSHGRFLNNPKAMVDSFPAIVEAEVKKTLSTRFFTGKIKDAARKAEGSPAIRETRVSEYEKRVPADLESRFNQFYDALLDLTVQLNTHNKGRIVFRINDSPIIEIPEWACDPKYEKLTNMMCIEAFPVEKESEARRLLFVGTTSVSNRLFALAFHGKPEDRDFTIDYEYIEAHADWRLDESERIPVIKDEDMKDYFPKAARGLFFALRHAYKPVRNKPLRFEVR